MGTENTAKSVAIFLLATLAFCAVPYALIIGPGDLLGGDFGYVSGLMWGPALGALVTIRWLKLDWASLGFAWRGTSSAWTAYLAPVAYGAIAYGFIWISGLGAFARPDVIATQTARLGWSISDPATFSLLFFLLLGLTSIVGAVAYGLGEELGWRGFLTPRLVSVFGFTRGTLVIGAIWTLWHVPLILFSNYNNGAQSIFALSCFTIMVFNLSFIMTWLRLKSGSVWPCAILHGSHNLFIQQFFTPLTSPTGDMTRYAIDEFGFAVPTVTFVVALYFWLRRGEALDAAEVRNLRQAKAH